MKELPDKNQKQEKMNMLSLIKKKLYPMFRDKKYDVSVRHNAACLFVMDLSESMNFPRNNPNIDRMNAALKQFQGSIMRQYEGSGIHLDVALVSFCGNKAEIVTEFTPIDQWEPVTMYAHGVTPMGQGIELSIDLAGKYRKQCRKNGIDLQKLWMILFTDGCPTDSIREASVQIRQQEEKEDKEFDFWIIASESADMKMCKKLTDQVLKMKDGEYESAFHSVQHLMLECKL